MTMTLAPLQRVLHAAARFVLDLPPRDHVTVALQTLHWLPVRQRITYKLCVLMHGVAFDYAPTYISVIPSCHSRYCRVERTCGRRTADSMTCHGCQNWLVPELSPSPVHKPGINSLHLFTTWTVSQLLSAILKLSCLKQHMV